MDSIGLMEPHKITMHKKVRKQRSKLRGLDFRCHDVSARRWPPHPESRDRVSTYSSTDHTSAHSISLFYISHISLRTSLTLLSISFSFILLLLLYHSHNSYYSHSRFHFLIPHFHSHHPSISPSSSLPSIPFSLTLYSIPIFQLPFIPSDISRNTLFFSTNHRCSPHLSFPSYSHTFFIFLSFLSFSIHRSALLLFPSSSLVPQLVFLIHRPCIHFS